MKRQGNAEDAQGNPKRPREAPKKPLSAYNIYFKQERTRLLDSHAAGTSPPDFDANLKDSLEAGKARKSAALFQAASRTIANRWKAMSPDERLPYEKLAKVETDKYDALKEEYEGERLQQMLLHERSKQVRPRHEPTLAVAGPSSHSISLPLDTTHNNDVARSPQNAKRQLRRADSVQEAKMATTPRDDNLDASNLSLHPTRLSGSPGAQYLPSGLRDQQLMTDNAPLLTDTQAQTVAHHFSGGMFGSVGSQRSASGAWQSTFPQGQLTRQAFSSVPQLLGHIERERRAASQEEVIAQLRQASTAQTVLAPDLLTQYSLLRNQQQTSSIHQLQDLLHQHNSSALRLEPPRTAFSSRDLSSLLLQNDVTLDPRYYLAPANPLQNMLSLGDTGGIDRHSLAATLLARDVSPNSSLLDLQMGLAVNSSANAATAAFLPESTDASAIAGVASLQAEVTDSLRLQQLQYLLDQRNRTASFFGSEPSRRASLSTREQVGLGDSSAFTLPGSSEPADTIRRQLYALLSQQVAPVVDRRSLSHSLLIGDLMSRPSANGPTAPPEVAESVRLQLLADLAERTEEEGKEDAA